MAIRLNDPGCQIVAGILIDLSNKNPESDIGINAKGQRRVDQSSHLLVLTSD